MKSILLKLSILSLVTAGAGVARVSLADDHPHGPLLPLGTQSIVLQPGSVASIQPLAWTTVTCAGTTAAPTLVRSSCSCTLQQNPNGTYSGYLVLVRVMSDGSLQQSEISATAELSNSGANGDCARLKTQTEICAAN